MNSDFFADKLEMECLQMDKLEIERLQMEMERITKAGAGVGASNVLFPQNIPGGIGVPFSLSEKMTARMNWPRNVWAVGFEHMAMHVAGGKVHIWIVTKDAQSVVLEDDAALYPSDALITKIRLMQKE